MEGDYGVGLFFRSWAWPLRSSERNSEGFSIPRDVGTVWGWPLPNMRLHTARSIKTWLREFGVDELDWPAQSPDLNPIEHLWDELERRLRATPPSPTSVSDLTNVPLEERSKIPINTPKPCGKPSQKS